MFCCLISALQGGRLLKKTRLTIGIPTFNRPERCNRAIQSALGQSVPVNVIVADDGDGDECERICKQWSDHPNFTYLKSPAKKLWHNWKWVAEQAIENGAEFFSWLQDDDLIADHHARRICRSFDYYPKADVYCARLAMAYDNLLGCHWTGSFGPRLPMDLLRGQPTDFPGIILLPIAYFDGWGMAPAKAFRVGPVFKKMLGELPDDCDMMTERLDLAYMGSMGGAIADPAIAGYWILHSRNGKLDNESQKTSDQLRQQITSAFRFLDDLMDVHPEWRENLISWMSCLGNPQQYSTFHGNLYPWKDISPYAGQILEILEDAMRSCGVTWVSPEPRSNTSPRTHLERAAL